MPVTNSINICSLKCLWQHRSPASNNMNPNIPSYPPNSPITAITLISTYRLARQTRLLTLIWMTILHTKLAYYSNNINSNIPSYTPNSPITAITSIPIYRPTRQIAYYSSSINSNGCLRPTWIMQFWTPFGQLLSSRLSFHFYG